MIKNLSKEYRSLLKDFLAGGGETVTPKRLYDGPAGAGTGSRRARN